MPPEIRNILSERRGQGRLKLVFKIIHSGRTRLPLIVQVVNDVLDSLADGGGHDIIVFLHLYSVCLLYKPLSVSLLLYTNL